MPSKIQLDENLWFLFICLQHSDMKCIDFHAVATSTNLKPPAARMRYTRLRRQIEKGTLVGTQGLPSTRRSMDKEIKRMGTGAGVGAGVGAERKRKRGENGKKADEEGLGSDDDGASDFDGDDGVPLAQLRRTREPQNVACSSSEQVSHSPSSEVGYQDEGSGRPAVEKTAKGKEGHQWMSGRRQGIQMRYLERMSQLY